VIRLFKIEPVPEDKANLFLRKKLIAAAEEEIDRLYALEQITEEERIFLIAYFKAHHRIFELSTREEEELPNFELARLKAIQVQRALLLQMWKNGEMDDKLLRSLEHELDEEETHSTRAEMT
jgi:hypothetical protein